MLIAIDSNFNTHFEFNKRGLLHRVLKFENFRLRKFEEQLPRQIVKGSISRKTNLIGGLELWIWYTKDYRYARIYRLGILEKYRGSIRALRNLLIEMDKFCKHYGIKFVEAETKKIPEEIMVKAGFKKQASKKLFSRAMQSIFSRTPWLKAYE